MFILKYWSLGHFLSIILPIAIIIGLYFLLRNRSQKLNGHYLCEPWPKKKKKEEQEPEPVQEQVKTTK